MLYWPLFNQQLKSEFTLRKLWIDFLLRKTLEPSEALQEPMFDCLGIDEISNPPKQILTESILSHATLMLNLDKTHTAFDIWNLSISVDNCYENKNHLLLHNGKQWANKNKALFDLIEILMCIDLSVILFYFRVHQECAAITTYCTAVSRFLLCYQ